MYRKYWRGKQSVCNQYRCNFFLECFWSLFEHTDVEPVKWMPTVLFFIEPFQLYLYKYYLTNYFLNVCFYFFSTFWYWELNSRTLYLSGRCCATELMLVLFLFINSVLCESWELDCRFQLGILSILLLASDCDYYTRTLRCIYRWIV